MDWQGRHRVEGRERGKASTPGRSGAWLVAIAAAGVVVVAMAVPSGRALGSGACENEERRAEQGVALPDCRAYELVTPANKASGEPLGFPGEFVGKGSALERESAPVVPDELEPVAGARAGLGGGRMAWLSEPVPGDPSPGRNHLAVRGASGWTSEGLVPPMSIFNDLVCPVVLGVSAWSQDLSRSILDLPAGPPAADAADHTGFFAELECGHDDPRLVPGEPRHLRNLFVHDNGTASYALVNATPESVEWPEPEEFHQLYWPASFLAASDDLSHVVFEEELALTPDAPIGYRGGDELYEWTEGQVRLVTILPDGTPVHGSLAGATRNHFSESEVEEEIKSNIAQFRHAISSDGSRIFFEAAGALYTREDGAETVQVDRSHGPGENGGGHFMGASADGARVFFTDESRLTSDSTAAPGAPDLYEYDAESRGLVDLTVDAAEPADVLGLSGISDDGSYVYFVARGALTEEANAEGEKATTGVPNLYVLHGGTTKFIASLDEEADRCDWIWNAQCVSGPASARTKSGLTLRIAGNGRYAAFNSARELTGYDNTDARTGERDIEIYLYDAGTDRLACVSCKPDGSAPTSGAGIQWPALPGTGATYWHNAYPQRNVSDRGQVFFETTEALVPQDVNGRRDVYEFEDGAARLISTGLSGAGSHFLDATPNGSDVFFSTAEAILPRDGDSLYDYYDARVGGGFPEGTSLPPSCDGGACRQPTPPVGTPVPGTASFVGRGRERPRHCGRHKALRHGRCVRRRRHRRRHGGHRRPHRHHVTQHRTAHTSRGGER